MRAVIATAFLYLALAGCGGSSGWVYSMTQDQTTPGKVEKELEGEFGLHQPRCRPASHSTDSFDCDFASKGAELELVVSQGTDEPKPTVTECHGAHERANEFITCAIGPTRSGGG
jgi:hypothetical protein